MARRASRTSFKLVPRSPRVDLLKPRARGFTIVELLIVVVVIAILAAITIVSYQGITARANDAAVQNDLSAFAKRIQLYAVENYGTYPTTTAVLSTLELRASRQSYETNEVNRGNLTYCTDGATPSARFVLVGKSKSGTVWIHSSTNGPGLYPDQAAYNGAHSSVCPALGFASGTYSSAQGYHPPQWGTPGWQTWVR